MIDTMAKMGQIWARFLFPMWFMGVFQAQELDMGYQQSYSIDDNSILRLVKKV